MPLAVVVGVGPGNGAAIAKRFSSAGFDVALLARSKGFAGDLAATLGNAQSYECDASDPVSIAQAFADIRARQGEVDSLLYNAGSGAWGSVEDISLEDFERNWRINALGLLACTKEVVAPMKAKGTGAIIATGATASLRGGAGTAAFAAAKAAQRSLVQSMARHLWPAGVHVALVIVDGVVDLPRTREQMADKPDEFFVKPEAVAETFLWLDQQDRSAWSFEVEARPFGEKW